MRKGMIIDFKKLNSQLNIHKLMGLKEDVSITQCHFHSDKKPSMAVSSETNTYYCFACGARGDAISYYAKMNDMGQYEAAKELALSIGFKSEGLTHSPRDAELRRDQKKYVEGLTLKHKKYLVGRGIESSGIEKYKLGGEGKWITQPIFSHTGKLVGHNKRSINGERGPDGFYIDKGFDKSNYLGGLNVVFDRPGPLIITESFFDIVQAYQEGINAVCTFGARLSETQADLALSYFKEVILAFDRDEAGIKGALEAYKLLKSKCLLATIDFADCSDLGEHLFINDGADTVTFYQFARQVNMSYHDIMSVIKNSMSVIERKKNLLDVAKDNSCSLAEMYEELRNV